MDAHPLQVDKLSFHYGSVKALDNVSFDIPAAGFVGLLGPNGAGKTTIFGLLTRLMSPQSGEIRYSAHLLDQEPARALQSLGVVFQQTSLDLDLSVAQNLHYHAALQGMSRKRARIRIQQELGRFDMQNRVDDKVRSLNQGHRRRVEIARALLHKPQILLLDEATAGLDFETRQMINQHIRQLCDDDGVSVLWATHLIEDIRTSDQLILLNQGKVIAQGNCEQLLRENHVTDLRQLMQKQFRAVA